MNHNTVFGQSNFTLINLVANDRSFDKNRFRRNLVEVYLYIALIIVSVALVAAVVLQSKGAGLGGLTGSDAGTVFSARRGIEKTLFRITIVLSVIFFLLDLAVVMYTG